MSASINLNAIETALESIRLAANEIYELADQSGDTAVKHKALAILPQIMLLRKALDLADRDIRFAHPEGTA